MAQTQEGEVVKKTKNIFAKLKRFQRSFPMRIANCRMGIIYRILKYLHKIMTIIDYDYDCILIRLEVPDWKSGIAKLRLEYRKRPLAFFAAYWQFALLWVCLKQLQKDLDKYAQIMNEGNNE